MGTGSCPTEAALDAFVHGRLAGPALVEVEAHLAGCVECRQLVAALASAPVAPDPSPISLARGVAVGRYLILEPIGAGAMGVVYVAYDPDLERKVALKLVRAHASVGDDGSGPSRERLLREAKAMARVKHRNVVAVFDAGVHRDQVFIAMELVEGTSLTRWLAESDRTPREIVERCVAAGRGLAAAHAAGVVHRDFKPDNVLVARDGEVYVTDFGLAQADLPAPPAASPEVLDPESSTTRSGYAAGTPAYMAPEQLRGKRADARSDQFAFCVTVCRALGKRPFTTTTVEDLLAAMEQGPDLPGAVPVRVRRALARGLSIDPAERFPSMEPLLAQLSGAGQRRARIAGAAVMVALLATATAAVASHARPTCGSRAASEVDALWTPRREQVREAFEATGSPMAASAFDEVDRVLGSRLADYRVARVATCEARALPDDPRVVCLAQRRRELGALFDVFSTADASVVQQAVLAAHGIRPITWCGDLETARTAGALATTSPESDAFAEKLAHVKALRDAGQYAAGLALAQEAVGQAATLPDPQFGLRARLLEGQLLSKTGQYEDAAKVDEDAYFDAGAGQDDEAAARAVLQLMRVEGDYLRRRDDALAWGRHADAALRRLGDPPLLRADWHTVEGIVADNASHGDEAIGHFQQALALDRESLGPDDPQIATDLAGLGSSLAIAGRFDEALVYQRQALAATEAALGPDHPLMVNRLVNVAITLGRSGHGAEGIPLLERALPLAQRALGPEHPLTLLTVGVLGAVYLEVEEYDKSSKVLEPATTTIIEKNLWNPNLEHLFLNLAIAQTYQHHLDDARESLARAHRCVGEGTERPMSKAIGIAEEGDIYLRAGDPQAALARYREARAVRENAGSTDIDLGESELAEGRGLLAVGRLDEAARMLGEAREHMASGYGPESFEVAQALVALGDTEARRGGAAAPLYEEAIRIAEHDQRIEELARACFGLANVVATSDPARARALAERARDTYAERDCFAPEKAEVETWLARLPAEAH